MMLKLKAFIYRHTGIFLANAETIEFYQSEEFRKDLLNYLLDDELRDEDDNDADHLNIALSLTIAMWQTRNGFYTLFHPTFSHRIKYFFKDIKSCLSKK